MAAPTSPVDMLANLFGPGAEAAEIAVPGRVNLIGEHIDYHNLAVLPMALQRRIRIAFRHRSDSRIRAASAGGFALREFDWTARLDPSPQGDWANYLKAAAQAVAGKWGPGRGIDAAVVSDLPPAAGLSSSSALLTAFTLALLRANGIRATFEELMEVLPEGEYFVGTRGGGMDHAAVLEARAGAALLIRFAPLSAGPVPVPAGWSFLVAHSLTHAEKSGALMAEYNSRRTAGARALRKLGFDSYAALIAAHDWDSLKGLTAQLNEEEARCCLHVAGESLRVHTAVRAMRAADADAFASALNDAHSSARDLLRISCPALDALVDAARAAGAPAARLTGAGFGGCAVIFCMAGERARIRAALMRGFYASRAGFDEAQHLIDAEPSAGALHL